MIPVKSEGFIFNLASNCKMRLRTMTTFITPRLVVTTCWPMYTKSLHIYLRLSKHPHKLLCFHSHDVRQAWPHCRVPIPMATKYLSIGFQVGPLAISGFVDVGILCS